MKDEIKEILNNADSSTKFKMVDEDGTEKEMNIAGVIEQLLNDNRNLLDYITNLQTIEKEYSFLLSENAELENRIKELEQINEEHRELNGKLREENESFKEYAKTYLKSKINRKNEELELVKTKLIEEHNKCYDYKTRNEKSLKDIDLLISGRYFKNNTGYLTKSCCNLRLEIIKNDLQGKSDE